MFRIAILLIYIIPQFAHSQGTDLLDSYTDSVFSEVLNENRVFYISLPENYDEGTDRYPVLYLTDGYQFGFVAGMVRQLSSAGKIMDMIVVGTYQTNRNRDLSAPSPFDQTNPNRGNGGRYLQFLNEELKPHLDNKYRTNPLAILSGHSLGGELMLYALRNHHEDFRAFICLSPSLGRNNAHELKELEVFFEEHSELPNLFYLAIGDEGGHTYDGTQKLKQLLQTSAPAGLHWLSERFASENHFSIPVRGHLAAFDFIFHDYYLPNHYGIKESLQLMEKQMEKTGKKLGIELKLPAAYYLDFVRKLISEREYDWALWELDNRYLNQFPDSVDRLHLKGEILLLQGKTEDIPAISRDILERDPNDELAKLWRAKFGE